MAVGTHGIGKSMLFAQSAKKMRIDIISRDLSLLEPPDLIGLPKTKGERTIYLPPAFLPHDGRGLLVFEELNRAEPHMRAPVLQLCTARTLNDYTLPPGWLPMAAINPAEGGHEVDELDPALLSRFARVNVVADQKKWLEWARHNGVHQAVIDYIADDKSALVTAEANPRAWKYVSDVLLAAKKQETSPATLRAIVLGLVGCERGDAFLGTLKNTDRPLSPEQVLNAYRKHRAEVQCWIQKGQIDLVDTTLLAVKTYLQSERQFKEVQAHSNRWDNLANFLHDLPGDLRKDAQKFFKSRGYSYPKQTNSRS